MRRVLIVDDRPDIRSVLSEALREAGYHAVEAEHADTAIAALSQPAFAAVITDILLRVGGGFDVAKAAQAHNVPVLLCTGDPHISDGLARAGVFHLRKPFRLEAATQWLEEQARATPTPDPPLAAFLAARPDRHTPPA
jgi:DNA-binding NtrC family response regulator